MEFRILGPMEVSRRGRQLHFQSPKQRALLALLVLHPRQVLSTDRILSEVWPAGSPASGVRTLRYHISKLRGGSCTARGGGCACQAPEFIADALSLTAGIPAYEDLYALSRHPITNDAGSSCPSITGRSGRGGPR